MCFTKTKTLTRTFKTVNISILTAKRDIVCYKTMSATLKSKHRQFQYKLKKLYAIKELKPYMGYPDMDINPCRGGYKITVDFQFEVSVGFHSFISKEIAFEHQHNDEVVIKCIIPKGSQYLKDDDEDADNYVYVSNKIKLLEIIKP